MSEAEGRPEDALVSLITSNAAGALEVRSGRKRWIFYVDSGRLVFTRSNLKSESAEAIRAELTNPTRPGIILAQAARRLRNALRGAGQELSVKAGEAAPKTLPIPTAAVLITGLAEGRDEASLRAGAAELLASWPMVVGDALVELGGDDTMEGYLSALDGERSGEDVLSFAPGGDIRRALAAMWVAWKLGSIAAGPEPVSDTAPGLGLDLGFDLDAVLAEATAAPPPSSAPEPSEPIRPPEPVRSPEPARPPEPEFEMDFDEAEADDDSYEAAVMSALGVSSSEDAALPDAPDTADAAPSPDPSPDPALPPQPVAGHLMAERLTTLAERVYAAENHFDVLGLSWEAPVEEFRAAYRDLARDLHPDRYIDATDEMQETATEVFDKIRAAFEVIGNDEERQKYTDKTIHGKKTEEELAMEQLQAYWSAESDFKKGLAAFNQGKLTSAHDFFTHAVDGVPDELEFRAYHAYTSFALERTRDPERALEHIDTLKSVIERNQEQERKLDAAWVLLGRAYRENGELETARRCIVQALRINASNSDATREMRRLKNPDRKPKEEKKKGGFFSKLFGKK
ncbi:MAG: J domain-containing protein [Myxococcota bacterium]|nr:J domain-containing protein [Myxococcota bacterium]